MMGVVICLVVFVDSHGGLTNFAPGGKKRSVKGAKSKPAQHDDSRSINIKPIANNT